MSTERRALNQSRLMELLTYDPDTGVFKWRTPTSTKCRPGDVAGCLDKTGVWRIMLDGKLYQAHRLVWLYVHGRWPSFLIDHKDRNRANNRLSNLREADRSENQWNSTKRKNNTSGHKGVYWNSRINKWVAQICVDSKVRYLGCSESLDEAVQLRVKASKKYHGEFARSE